MEFLPWWFKKLSWKTPDGRKLYEGNWLCCSPETVTKINIQFWAHHPTAAMREIAKRLTNGTDPGKLEKLIIN